VTRRPHLVSRLLASSALAGVLSLLLLGAGVLSGCATSQSDPPVTHHPVKGPPWGYRVIKSGCPDLMVAAFPYLNNKDKGENICLDDAGSCLNRHSSRCSLTGSPKDCGAIGPGWSSIFDATCSNGCEPMPNQPVYAKGIYGVEVDPANGCVVLVKFPNVRKCKKALPGPKPFISRCIVLGDIGNCKDHCY
jgi:hypothetical protein